MASVLAPECILFGWRHSAIAGLIFLIFKYVEVLLGKSQNLQEFPEKIQY